MRLTKTMLCKKVAAASVTRRKAELDVSPLAALKKTVEELVTPSITLPGPNEAPPLPVQAVGEPAQEQPEPRQEEEAATAPAEASATLARATLNAWISAALSDAPFPPLVITIDLTRQASCEALGVGVGDAVGDGDADADGETVAASDGDTDAIREAVGERDTESVPRVVAV